MSPIGVAMPRRMARQTPDLETPAPRLLDGMECVLSVALAILLAHWLGTGNVSWAAFTGYLVMRSRLAESAQRGALRVVGTALGSAIAMVVVPLVVLSTPLASFAAGLVGLLSLYGALTHKRSYAWLLVGITFEMVLLDSAAHPAGSVAAFARTRLLDIVVGTVASLSVNLVSCATLRRRWRPAGLSNAQLLCRSPVHALRHAAQGAAALALLPWLWRWTHLPELSQGAVTILAVMMVPVSTGTAHGFGAVGRRLFHRIAGCLIGALLAGTLLLLSGARVEWLVAGTILGVLIGRQVETGPSSYAYVGTQFTLAVLVTLVPDSYSNVEIGPGADRLAGILAGMLTLAPLMVLWRFAIPGGKPIEPAEPGKTFADGD